jgi:hypothetical protein
MASTTYDEAFWDGDDDTAPSPQVGREAAAPRPRSETKFQTMKVPFSFSIKNGDLKNKSSLTFSVKNRALNAANFEYSNEDEFNVKDKDGRLPFNLVSKVSLQNFQAIGFREPLEAKFETICTVPRQTFSSLSTATQAATSAAKSTAVSFAVTPNKELAGSFDAKISSDVLDHVSAYPVVRREDLAKTYGQMGGRMNWANLDSPVLHMLTPEQDKLLENREELGVYEYHGDITDLEAAEKKFIETHENNVVYSDLTPESFRFSLSVPAVNRYDAKTDLFVTSQPTFYELAMTPQIRAFMQSKTLMASPEAKAAFALFDNQDRKFSGVAVVEFQPTPPKAQE